MTNYRKGDIVRCTQPWDGNSSVTGKMGKVVGVSSSGEFVTVEFFDRIDYGHDGGATGEKGHCWSIAKRALEPVYLMDDCRKFKVGDVVKTIVRVPGTPPGAIGFVRGFDEPSIAVEFVSYNPIFHNCAAQCKYGHGWYVTEDEIELVERPKVKE